MIELKNIYRGREVKYYDFLMSQRQGLIDEFLKSYPDFVDSESLAPIDKAIPEFSSVITYNEKGDTSDTFKDFLTPGKASWNTLPTSTLFGQELKDRQSFFPTAFKIKEFFGDNVRALTYSSLEPNSAIFRHVGIENKEATHIRIHIPLLVPDGDIGFEVWGEEVYWDDIFAFNNQKVHSAWNHTNKRRLVFLLDVKRSYMDMPPAPEWYPGCNENAPFFSKTARETWGTPMPPSYAKYDKRNA